MSACDQKLNYAGYDLNYWHLKMNDGTFHLNYGGLKLNKGGCPLKFGGYLPIYEACYLAREGS